MNLRDLTLWRNSPVRTAFHIGVTCLVCTSDMAYAYPACSKFTIVAQIVLLTSFFLLDTKFREVRSFLFEPLFAALTVLSLVFVVRSSGALVDINIRVLTWAFLPLWYLAFRSLKDDRIEAIAALILGVTLIMKGAFGYGQNVNTFCWVVAGSLLLTYLRRPEGLFTWLVPGALAGSYFLTCRSVSLATAVAFVGVYCKRVSLMIIALLTGLAALMISALVQASEPFHLRDRLYAMAVASFRSSPLYGVGFGPSVYLPDRGQVMYHSHNMPLTVAAETGLIGLAAFGWVVFLIVKQWSELPRAVQALILLYGTWSLFDEPLQWLNGALIFLMALSRAHPRAAQPSKIS